MTSDLDIVLCLEELRHALGEAHAMVAEATEVARAGDTRAALRRLRRLQESFPDFARALASLDLSEPPRR